MHVYSSGWNLWDWAPERHALLLRAQELPTGLERAQARLRLARLGPFRSLWARQQVLNAQNDLTGLFSQAPETAGLLKAAVDANRTFNAFRLDGTTTFYQQARAFVERRWNGNGSDAAEAGYRLSELVVASNRTDEQREQLRTRERLLQEIIGRFPNSDWAMESEFDLIGLRHSIRNWTATGPGDDAHLQQYAAFADSHPGHDLAARALLTAAQGYGFGEYGQAQQGGVSNVQRLERAMQLHIRYRRAFPDGASRDPAFSATQPEPSIELWGDQTVKGDTAQLEESAVVYYALNPRGATPLINTIARLEAGLAVSEFPAFYRRFWDRVEAAADTDRLPDVLLARAWYLFEGEPYSTPEYRRRQLEEAAGILQKVADVYPKSDQAAVALDALALIAVQLLQPQQALARWDELARRFPEHALNRPAAIDRLFLQFPPETQHGALWRRALSDLQTRFDDDPLIALCTHSLRAGSLQFDDAPNAARNEFETALADWPVVFPLDRIDIASQGVALGPLHEIQAGRFAAVGWAPEATESEDLRLLARQSVRTLDERLAVYSELGELFPDSPHRATHLWRLAEAQLEAGGFADARDTFRRVATIETDPPTRLAAEVYAIRLDYQLTSKPVKQDAIRKLTAALREYADAAAVADPEGPREADAESLFRHAYAEQWAPQMEVFAQRLTANNGADRWFVVSGSSAVPVEFHDGLLLKFTVTPPLPAAVAGRTIRLTGPDLLLRALGVGDPQAAAFVSQVVSGVFAMNTAENVDLADTVLDSTGKQYRAPRDPDAPLPPSGPLIVQLPDLFSQFLFFDGPRNRAETRSTAVNCVAPQAFYERTQGKWQKSDAHGWFRWEP